LKGHTKKVNRVVFHPSGEDTAITASHDSTIRLWNIPTSQTLKLLKIHDGPVTGLSLHATGDYILSTSLDQHWAFSDIREGRLVTKVSYAGQDGSNSAALTCAQFHPDGLIFGTGTSDAVIKIWDLKEVIF
jgi:pre-mRNA-processing factor 19